jgi:Holliday junction resolvase RusA-like endonuclease
MHGTYVVSWPPSVNELWRSWNGRNILSSRARRWKAAAELELLAQKPVPVPGQVAIHIELASPYGRRFDPDNKVKALLDLLVKNGIIEDDSDKIIKEQRVTVDGEGFKGARVTITKR